MSHESQRPSVQVQLRALMASAALLLLIYVALLAAFSKTSFPTHMATATRWPVLMDKPVGEDGYYMLTVAENIASTGHIRYNGGVPATGIQPLATVLFAGLDWLVHAFGGGVPALIRSVMGFGTVLLVVFAMQIRRIAMSLSPDGIRSQAGALAFLLTLFSFTLFRLFTYGLETGIYLVLIAACFQVTLRIAKKQRTDWSDAVLLGLAAGFAGEARIDFGLLFAILLATLLLYRWISLAKTVVAGSIALLVVSPWFLFVHRVSGSWLPTSGKAESTMITAAALPARLSTMLVAVAGEVMPWCYAVRSNLTLLVAAVSAGLLVWFVAARRDHGQLLRKILLSRLGVLWVVCLLSLLPIYLVLFNATHFYYRYMAPLAVLTLPVCAIALAQSDRIRRHMSATAVVLCAAFCFWTAGSLHTGHIGNSQTLAAGYVQQNFSHAHVGAFQSGVMGFFNPNVENLDGKLNQGALNATARHQLPDFIDSEGINVLVDWPSVLQGALPPSYLQSEWKPCPVPMVGDAESVCLIRKSAEAR
ncbi:MAG: hypothetical protein ACRYGF_16105 [Janthinobacterium lividum]